MSDEMQTEIQAAADAAVDAAKATVDWKGVKVTVPISDLDDADGDAVEALENNHTVAFLRSVLGSKAYDAARQEFKTVNGHRPSIVEITGGTGRSSKSNESLAALVLVYLGFESAGE